MRIVIAPDSFKESLSAREVTAAIARGWCRVRGDDCLHLLPMADGGEGSCDAIHAAIGGAWIESRVCGPDLVPRVARWLLLPAADGRPVTAVIEMAAASGLEGLAPERRNPRLTTTQGTGELVLAALDRGCRRIVLGIGGSATNDGGAGFATALGVRFLDAEGMELEPGGAALRRLARIDAEELDPRLAATAIQVACDVDNPLTGPRGASVVYGPQKGADPDMVSELDCSLAHYARILEAACGRQLADCPGAGAAGGLGAALLAFTPARLLRGVDLVADLVGLDRAIAVSDLVITGEGSIDAQTAHGKCAWGVARRAHDSGVPVIALGGRVTDAGWALQGRGFDAVFSVSPGILTLEEALAGAALNLERTADALARLIGMMEEKND